ncbi:SDR family NAD(P)-dependent oxidoreductase, partial [Streptomyces sodiiphilus]
MTRLRHHLDAADPVVGDHRIGGMPVLPAAAQIDALLTACDSARPDRQWLLSQVSFLAPLTVTGAGAEVVTTVDGDGQCSVGSRPAGHDGGTGDDWTVHSRARAVSRPLTPPHYLDVAELRASCGDGVPLSAVTRWRESSGIDYGPAFRAIRTAHRGPDRMLTLLRAPQEPAGPHFVPPALLDSLFQCLGMLDDGAAGPCLPWVVGRVAARRPVSGSVLALVERTVPAGGASGIAQGRATVCNQQGEVLLELDRITLKGLPPGEPATRQSVTVAVSPGPPDRPAPEDRPSTTSPAGPPGGQISRTGWRPVVPTAEPTPEQGALLVVAPEDGPVPAWAETGGRPVIRLAMEKLLDEGNGALPQDTTVGEVVCLVPEDLTGPTAATACLRGLFSLVRHLAAHPPMPSLTLVTGAAHDVTGEDTVDPLHTAVWGLARTLRTEHPNTRIRLLDIGRNSDQAPPVAVRFTQPELARRGDGWYEPCLDPVPGPPSPSLPDGGRYLITGGMGGIGLHVAEFLAERGCAHLTLVGRSVPQDGELRQRLDRLAGSCDLAVVRADVRTLPEALRGAGRFDGVFHAAGVLRDGLARSLSGERIDEVFAPKIGGVHALDEAFTPETRPGFVALFSSVSAVHGNLGQSSYATANAYLDGYAARRRSEGEVWYSLGWGLWTVGMGRDIVKGAAARGIPALSAAEGTALLGAVLGLPPAHYVLSATATPKGAQMTAVTPESRLWPVLSTTLRRILQAGDVSPQDNLLEMGLDSMMAVEVAAALASEGLDVDAAVFFEHADVGALLAHLESLPRDISGAAPLSGGQDGTAHRATGHAADAFRIPAQTPGPAPAHTVPASRPPAAAAPVSPRG